MVSGLICADLITKLLCLWLYSKRYSKMVVTLAFLEVSCYLAIMEYFGGDVV
jgi:hypothetical protein